MGEWDELYRENILDHYKNPRCRGTLDHPDITYEDANPLCGDQLRIDIEVKDGKIEKIRHSGHGCSISQAAASMLCERMEGHPLEEVKALTKEDVLELLGIELGPVRLKCALLPLKVLKAGVYGLGEASDELVE